jgi:hypothetical protein
MVKWPLPAIGGNMRRLVLLILLACATFISPASAKRQQGSYIDQYLGLTEQINTLLPKLRKDVLAACGKTETVAEVKKPKRKKGAGKTKTGADDSAAKSALPELDTKAPEDNIAAPKEQTPEAATLRAQLIAELPERVSAIRRKAQRLREIAPLPSGLRRANTYVVQYSRDVDAMLDLLKQATYSGTVDVAALDALRNKMQQNAALAERDIGQFLDATPVVLPAHAR